MIVGLFTEMLSAGGCSAPGARPLPFWRSLRLVAAWLVVLLVLNDAQGLHTVRVGPDEFSVSGYARSKVRFVLSALRAAGRRPLLVVAMHPHLAPIVDVMRMRSRSFRSIIFTHGIEVWQPLSWPRGPALLRRAGLVIAPSEDTANHLVFEQKVDPGKVLRLPWGLDPEFEERLQNKPPAPRARLHFRSTRE